VDFTKDVTLTETDFRRDQWNM